MTVTDIRKDAQARTMTLDAEFDASPERVWQLWADPRQLERWWGPPTYPATVDTYDLRPGGHVDYHMTGPEGDQPRGFWEHGDTVVITHRGRKAVTLRGSVAVRFLEDVQRDDPQQVMARATGDYKRGNERVARGHPRNR